MNKLCIEITKDMVGKKVITAFGKKWWVGSCLGNIMNCDVGKRIYLGNIIQIENQNQYIERTTNSINFIKRG